MEKVQPKCRPNIVFVPVLFAGLLGLICYKLEMWASYRVVLMRLGPGPVISNVVGHCSKWREQNKQLDLCQIYLGTTMTTLTRERLIIRE